MKTVFAFRFIKKSRVFDYRRITDITIRVILGLFFAFSAGVYYKNALAHIRFSDFTHLNVSALSSGLSILAIGLYTMMIAFLYVLRLQPVTRFPGFWPALAALLGGFMMFGLLWFKPRTDLPLSLAMAASLLSLSGNFASAYILTRLGRSFSIIPEGRRLVTTGPYKYIRHPLYLAEAVATLGAMILFLSWGAVALVITQAVLQLVRIHYEERVLCEAFPAYRHYSKHTARLIPGLY